MRFSIVVPSFNQGPYLADCLESLVTQNPASGAPELIVVDGGSTDHSIQTIRRYADRLDFWVSEPDRGQTHALIKGFQRATGDVMGWVNSDDALLPGALQAVGDFFSTHPDVEVVYGDALCTDCSGRLLKHKREIDFDLSIFLWDYNYLPQPSTFWRTSAWQRSGGLDETLQCAMDCDLWLKFVRAGARFAHVPRTLSRMRLYPQQKNQRLRNISNYEDQILRQRFLGRSAGSVERQCKWAFHKFRRILKRGAAGAYWRCAAWEVDDYALAC